MDDPSEYLKDATEWIKDSEYKDCRSIFSGIFANRSTFGTA